MTRPPAARPSAARPGSWLVFLIVAAAAFVLASSRWLPPVVASHFDAAGNANGAMPRHIYTLIMTALIVVAPGVVAFASTRALVRAVACSVTTTSVVSATKMTIPAAIPTSSSAMVVPRSSASRLRRLTDTFSRSAHCRG